MVDCTLGHGFAKFLLAHLHTAETIDYSPWL